MSIDILSLAISSTRFSPGKSKAETSILMKEKSVVLDELLKDE